VTDFYPKVCNHGKLITFDHATSKVVCVGRNYQAHAEELNNPIPNEPLLFIKSTNTLVDLSSPVVIPQGQGECQHELEIALLIGEKVDSKTPVSIKSISAVGLALDLTLRELQSELKQKGHPWERAKNFDGACPVSEFIPIEQLTDWPNIEFSMTKNDKLVQSGHTRDMIFKFAELIQSIVACFTLYPGDIVLTGTPQGVAKLANKDQLCLNLADKLTVKTKVK
jgi:2-keto-4-pentenoate hydratase/2-oxohepta-3-ene-1,7-dioic acid hydratase in catechol pathway